MGAMQNNAMDGGKKPGKRGSVRNSSRLDAFSNGRKKGGADWGECHPDRLQATVVAITALGGAITFGLSRDMGAHSLTLMLDDSRATMWYNGDANLDDCLDDVIARLAASD